MPLRNHGMKVNALQLVFKSVLGKMTYAVSAWWGYTTAADKQRLEALIRRAVRVGLYQCSRRTKPASVGR